MKVHIDKNDIEKHVKGPTKRDLHQSAPICLYLNNTALKVMGTLPENAYL